MWLLIGMIMVLLGYIGAIHRQIRQIHMQLQQHIGQQREQPIQLQLFNTELNHLVEQINELIQQEQSIRMLSKQEQQYYKEMISNISHDFRTPLTSIKGYQQLLSKEALSEEQHAKLRIANAHVEHLEKLLETFFEYSYLLSHQEPAIKEPVYVNALIEQYAADFYAEFENKGVTLHIHAPYEKVMLLSDEGMLRRILQNLIQNALQHSEEDVYIQYWQEADFTYVTFKNRIQHNTPVNAEQLFDRFFTIDRTRKRNSGLGLSIVRLLSEKLGGSAHAVVENGYLTFIIKIEN